MAMNPNPNSKPRNQARTPSDDGAGMSPSLRRRTPDVTENTLERAQEIGSRLPIHGGAGRIQGALLATQKRNREDPVLDNIQGSNRKKSNPSPSHRLAVTVAGAIANNLMAQEGVLQEGKSTAPSGTALERAQVVVTQVKEPMNALNGALEQVHDLVRALRDPGVSDIHRLLTRVSRTMAAESCASPGGAILESGVYAAAIAQSGRFSESPDEERKLKVRFYSVQHDGLHVNGSRSNGVTPAMIFGIAWMGADGKRESAGIQVPKGTAKGMDKNSLDSASREPLMILEGVCERDPGEPEPKRVVVRSQPMEDFLCERGLDLQILGSSITADQYEAMLQAGLYPITSSVRTGDFLPSGVQERLIPGDLVFEGIQLKTVDIERLRDTYEDLEIRVGEAIRNWASNPANKERVKVVAEQQEMSIEDLIQSQQEILLSTASRVMGIKKLQLLQAMKEYQEARKAFPKSVQPDPYQIQLGRDITTLCKDLGVQNKSFLNQIDKLINKAQSTYEESMAKDTSGKMEAVFHAVGRLDRRAIVMNHAMDEIKAFMVAKLGIEPGEERYERIEKVLGEEAKIRLMTDWKRNVRSISKKVEDLERSAKDVLAEGITDIMIATGEFTNAQAKTLRGRVLVALGGAADPYVKHPKAVNSGEVTEWNEPNPKPGKVEAIDAKIAEFLVTDEKGAWLNPHLRRLLDNPTEIYAWPDVAGPDSEDADKQKAEMKAPMLRALEGFRMVDTLYDVMEQHRILPNWLERLPKGLGSIMRDTREDDLKGSQATAFSTPACEKGRIYLAPIEETSKGISYLMVKMESRMDGSYGMSERKEIPANELPVLLDTYNHLDFRIEILRHAVSRDVPNEELLRRFKAFPIGEGLYLVGVTVQDSGMVNKSLGLEFGGGAWPEAGVRENGLDSRGPKDGFVRQVPRNGAGWVLTDKGATAVAGGTDLGGPHTYVRVWPKGEKRTKNLYLPIPTSNNEAEARTNTTRFANWLDQRKQGSRMNRDTEQKFESARTIMTNQYLNLQLQYSDARYKGYVAFAPTPGSGMFQPPLMSQVFVMIDESSASSGANGKPMNAWENQKLIEGFQSLCSLKANLGCACEYQTVQV